MKYAVNIFLLTFAYITASCICVHTRLDDCEATKDEVYSYLLTVPECETRQCSKHLIHSQCFRFLKMLNN